LPLAKVANHRLGFEVSTPLPFARSYELAKFLLRLGLPFRVSPSCHRMRPDCPTSCLVHKLVARPSRGLIPFDVFPAARSHIPPTDSQSIGSCCVLRVSHPLDALLPARPIGLISSRTRPWGSPFEAFILPQRRTPFSTSVPSWGSRWFRRISSPLQGYSTLREARPRKLGFSQSAVSYASLSFASSEVSCLLRSVSG
jgi:hypothetical protein